MSPGELEQLKAQIVSQHGEWKAHNIHLGHGVYTRGAGSFGDERRVLRIVQLVSDLANRPWHELRILDLGCNEGLFAIELASRGATVLGIEARTPNLVKARFARDVLKLTNLDFAQEDVRELDESRHGLFDVVVCPGLLYHLDAPDLLDFAKRMRRVCRSLAIVDTHIALSEDEQRTHRRDAFWFDPHLLGPLEHRVLDGLRLTGRRYTEHDPGSSREARLGSLWASIDNVTSFWPTRASLVNLLSHAGFGTILEAHAPLRYPPDRVMLVAFPSPLQALRTTSPVIVNETIEETDAAVRETSEVRPSMKDDGSR